LVTAASVSDASGDKRTVCLLRCGAKAGGVPPERLSALDLDVLQAMIEASEDGLTIVAGDGTILYLNARSAELTGIEKDMIGWHVKAVQKAHYVDRSVSLEVIRQRAKVTTVQTFRGGKRVLVTGRPILTPAGTVKYVVLTDRDIAELSDGMSRLEEGRCLSDRYGSKLRMLQMRGIENGQVVARSARMRAVYNLAIRCATVDSPILILGETGTGKGLFARLIHQVSGRSTGPFVELNCGAIPGGLLESELFGYAKGAFTGADPKGKAGLIEGANNGTLVLNEIGELSLSLQVKLLRFLEDGEIQPIGAVRPRRPDVRIIAATNRNLSELIAQGRFRQDLFYRLNVLVIDIPPLREHPDDIPSLVALILSQIERKLDKRRTITPRALGIMSQYSFPGNVRELRNLIERLVVSTEAEIIDVTDLPPEFSEAAVVRGVPSRGTFREAIRRTEIAILKTTMQQFGTQMAAAKHLGLAQATISRKLKQYALQ
jgi:PAS domain S-box-containing protein